MRRNPRVIPALMFHSVGLQGHPWVWSHISEPLETFERKIALLKREGFTCVFWGELYDYMVGRRTLPENSVLLTFDDGYLDNWVHVFPILRKYGMKGTIFVSPDFVHPRDDLRPNLDDLAAGRCQRSDFAVAGFLSWAEMREMERGGLIDIQSHAMTHTWYFSGPRIVGFHEPQRVTPHPWLFWNARPERKPFYLTENQQEFLPWGYPVLEHQKSLVARRFFPAPGAVAEITDFVAARGGRDFFRHRSWRTELEAEIAVYCREGMPGRYETDDEREARLNDELRRSKFLIEQNLGKNVDFICWPGGGNDAVVQAIARKAGYKSWTLSSTSQLEKRNLPGDDPTAIKRIGTSNSIEVRGRRCGTGGERYQLWRVREHQGSALHWGILRAYKLSAYALSFIASR